MEIQNDNYGCKYNRAYDRVIIDKKTKPTHILCEECNVRFRSASTEPWDKFDSAKVCRTCHYDY